MWLARGTSPGGVSLRRRESGSSPRQRRDSLTRMVTGHLPQEAALPRTWWRRSRAETPGCQPQGRSRQDNDLRQSGRGRRQVWLPGPVVGCRSTQCHWGLLEPGRTSQPPTLTPGWHQPAWRPCYGRRAWRRSHQSLRRRSLLGPGTGRPAPTAEHARFCRLLQLLDCRHPAVHGGQSRRPAQPV